VRGYLENQLVRDNACIASLEARIPLVQNRRWADVLQLAPFVDFGHAWNNELPTPEPRTIASIGLGLRWGATVVSKPFPLRPEFEIYWGYQLEDVETDGNTLQDHGIHLQFLLHAF
jgi:hemolysin activation/secretion protein